MPFFFPSFGSNLISTVTAFPLGIPCFLPDLHHPLISSWHSLLLTWSLPSLHFSCHSLLLTWSSPSLHFLLPFFGSYLIFTALSFSLVVLWFLPDIYSSFCHSLILTWFLLPLPFFLQYCAVYLTSCHP